MKILIIQQKMIGDVLTSSILFEVLRLKYPKAELHYLINEHTSPVVENNPFIDYFIFFTSDIEKSKLRLLKLTKTIQKENFDIVIDAYCKLSSNLVSAFSGAKIKISKYKWYSSLIYTHPIKFKNSSSTPAGLAIENRLQLLEPIDIELSKKIIKPKIYLSNAEKEKAKQTLLSSNIDLNKPIFMISVLGSGKSKTYPIEYMSQLIDFIVKQTNGQLLFNYIPSQIETVKTIFKLCKTETQKHIFLDCFGNNLREFLGLTSFCNAIIGNEGGAINMAKALNIPTFAIFSPWIEKKVWATFEDENNVSVHLKDYKPDYFQNKEGKKLKKDALNLYQEFKPSLFLEKLNGFLNTILK
ncbi:lipopolysaccharide heptosyltransferase family protein [Flavobacteriaceae bacterium XHP0103]|uniref:glycosyltransferase family 9 protein n=1 Tax=Marixanthotalea marina TaxID=2844359 RepID=UPI0029899F56|nr:glycosyltransferase family 9 protein [Marixanthotalea marina]MBU3822406.1 lipopolysaccharide heptosyltransferase family protein [Marixanthotalea marina]